MEIDYIIVQAGGRGSRLGFVTDNKPKALAPIENLPIIFHLFQKFPEKHFIIIGDYRIDVLRRYLDVFAKVKYLVVDAGEDKGTCAGIVGALKYLPKNAAFMLIWSDLILSSKFALPSVAGNYVGISKTFVCRWRYENGKFEESSSNSHGVAGVFIFENKKLLEKIDASGEFVKWLQKQEILFHELPLYEIREYGVLKECRKKDMQKCRPFNRMTIQNGRVIKEAIDDLGKELAIRERNWYQKAYEIGVEQIPEIYQMSPLVMEQIKGKNIFEYVFSVNEKKEVLRKIVLCLKELHRMVQIETDYFSLKEAYYTKTEHRLSKVRNLIPMSDRQKIRVNGRDCHNVYYYMEELERLVDNISPPFFCFIHGDCTFSNLLLDENRQPVLIDPRGYFGNMEYYGDPLYDWAKLYYSLVGNYDKFNLGHFRIHIKEDEIFLEIESNGWEDMEDEFFALLGGGDTKKHIKLLHAIIWLSLTTYTWQDYDSICGAFYNGIYYLEECFEEEEKDKK